MLRAFDRRVLSDRLLELVRACQRCVPCHLGGGAALSGVYLRHRLTGDLDLFCHRAGDLAILKQNLDAIAIDSGVEIDIVRDSPRLVRTVARLPETTIEMDLVEEPVADLEPPPPAIEGIVVESLADLRTNKLTCLLSRSEPRDLVDLLFLDRAGYPPENDLKLALRKDAGIDPGILAWLLGQFPCRPLPRMLEPLSPEQLRLFRDELRERLRRIAVPGE